MTLQSPSALWLLGLLVPLVLLHWLRAHRNQVVVSATWLWREAYNEHAAPVTRRRFRVSRALLLQALFIILIAIGAAKPELQAGTLQPKIVFVLDVSASMATKEEGNRTRLGLAKEKIRTRLQSLSSDAELMLITAGSEARLRTPLSRNRSHFQQALSEAEVLDQNGNMAQALSLAEERLMRHPNAKVVLVTDGALANRALKQRSGLETITVGSAKDNVGIVHVAAQNGIRSEPPTARVPIDVFVRVRNFGTQPRRITVTLFQHNVVDALASESLELAPQAEQTQRLRFDATESDRGTALVVKITPGDAFITDDQGFALVPEPQRQTVILHTTDKAPWLKKALLADPEVELQELSRDDAAPHAEGALHIYSGYCPPLPPEGPFVVVRPPQGLCFGTQIGAPIDDPGVTAWKETDPRLRFLSLADLVVEQSLELKVPPRQVILNSRRGPLIAEVQARGRNGTLLGFRPSDSNWPLQTSFVLFVRNLVEYARAQRFSAAERSARSGVPVRSHVPPQVRTLTLHHPNGQQTELKASNGTALLAPLDRSGVYHISSPDSPKLSQRLVVNLSSPQESDLRELPLSLPTTLPNAPKRPQQEQERNLPASTGWWFAILALVVLLAETSLFTQPTLPEWLKRRSRPLASSRRRSAR